MSKRPNYNIISSALSCSKQGKDDVGKIENFLCIFLWSQFTFSQSGWVPNFLQLITDVIDKFLINFILYSLKRDKDTWLEKYLLITSYFASPIAHSFLLWKYENLLSGITISFKCSTSHRLKGKYKCRF